MCNKAVSRRWYHVIQDASFRPIWDRIGYCYADALSLYSCGGGGYYLESVRKGLRHQPPLLLFHNEISEAWVFPGIMGSEGAVVSRTNGSLVVSNPIQQHEIVLKGLPCEMTAMTAGNQHLFFGLQMADQQELVCTHLYPGGVLLSLWTFQKGSQVLAIGVNSTESMVAVLVVDTHCSVTLMVGCLSESHDGSSLVRRVTGVVPLAHIENMQIYTNRVDSSWVVPMETTRCCVAINDCHVFVLFQSQEDASMIHLRSFHVHTTDCLFTSWDWDREDSDRFQNMIKFLVAFGDRLLCFCEDGNVRIIEMS